MAKLRPDAGSIAYLSPKIREYLQSVMGWAGLRPVQEKAIGSFFEQTSNLVITAKTAAGKTEAAFLPTIDQVISRPGDGIRLLYIAPTRALINDQYRRIKNICDHLGLRLTRWHSDSPKKDKEELKSDPQGIIMTTPESIESIFITKFHPYRKLLSQIEFIIIDEIHSFLGNDRGRHLQSLLARVINIPSPKPRLIALSATISQPDQELLRNEFWDNQQQTVVISDESNKKFNCWVNYLPLKVRNKRRQISDLIEKIRQTVGGRRALVFPNSRNLVEEITYRLKRSKQTDRQSLMKYFAHHSSISNNKREEIEARAKSEDEKPFAIICTSTLELGIDIGAIDMIIQVDSTNSVASLAQRIGRSGRRGNPSQLVLYATNEWDLLQAIACIDLHQDGNLEPTGTNKAPYNVFLHQIISFIKQMGKVGEADLKEFHHQNPTFSKISDGERDEIVANLIARGIIMKSGDMFPILAIPRKIDDPNINRDINGQRCYALFKTDKQLTVFNRRLQIGSLPPSMNLHPGRDILLDGAAWRIESINGNMVNVVEATNDGKPTFWGIGGGVHHLIRQRMRQIILNNAGLSMLDDRARECIHGLRWKFMTSGLGAFKEESRYYLTSLIFDEGNRKRWYTFLGTNAYNTLCCILKYKYNIKVVDQDERSASIIIANRPDIKTRLIQVIKLIKESEVNYDELVEMTKTIIETPSPGSYMLPDEGKFSQYLPTRLRAKQLVDQYFDIDGVNKFIQQLII